MMNDQRFPTPFIQTFVQPMYRPSSIPRVRIHGYLIIISNPESLPGVQEHCLQNHMNILTHISISSFLWDKGESMDTGQTWQNMASNLLTG